MLAGFKAVRRFALRALAASSLALAGVAVFGWVRSRNVTDEWYWTRDSAEWRSAANGVRLRNVDTVVVESRGGGLFLQWYRLAHAPYEQLRSTPSLEHQSSAPGGYPDIGMLGPTDAKNAETHSFHGFGYGHYADWEERPEDVYETDYGVVFPHAAAVAIFSLLPGFMGLSAIRAWAVRRARLRRNACVACGYDLRASPSGCPECGAGVSS